MRDRFRSRKRLRDVAACAAATLIFALAAAPAIAAVSSASVAAPPAFVAAPPASVAAPPDTMLEEVIVTGERTGPGLWHVFGPGADLWILGSVSPLPKDMTWRSAEIERRVAGARSVMVTRHFEVGIVRALWLLLTQRDLFMVGGGRRLKDVMPADLYARFSAQRAKYTDDAAKWERFRPLIATAFLQQAALRRVGLSARLDIGDEVRSLARAHDVPVDEIKIAGLKDVLEALRTLRPAVEDACVAAGLATVETGLPRLVERARAWATGDVERMQSLPEPPEVNGCRDAVGADAGAGDLLALIRRTMLDAMTRHLQAGGTTVAVVNIDLLLEPKGVLDTLRARGYRVEAPSP